MFALIVPASPSLTEDGHALPYALLFVFYINTSELHIPSTSPYNFTPDPVSFLLSKNIL